MSEEGGRVGIIFGEATTTRATIAVTAPTLALDDFVQLDHPIVGTTLARVSILRRSAEMDYEAALKVSHGATAPRIVNTGELDLLGYYDKVADARRPLPSPPTPGAAVERAPGSVIRDVLGLERRRAGGMYLGLLAGHEDLKVFVDPNELLSRHFAILAQTGSGKSFLAGVIVEELIEQGIAIVILDSHGEYSSLMSANTDDKDIARMPRFGVTPKGYLDSIREYTPDTDVNPNGFPLRFNPANLKAEDILAMTAIGDSKSQTTILYRGLSYFDETQTKLTFARLIERVSKDKSKSRFQLVDELKRLAKMALFDAPATSLKTLVKPGRATLINLRGTDEQIQHVIVYRIVRRLFEARKLGRIPPMLLLIEEAHNFVPLARVLICTKAIRNAVGEGRKFGFGVGIISQRSAKLDTSTLSQCTSHLVLKMTNPNDLMAVTSAMEGYLRGLDERIQQLPVGYCILSSPGYPVPICVEIRPRRSKHGGATARF